MRRLYFISFIILILLSCNNINKNKEPINYLEGRYKLSYILKNESINTVFNQYIDFYKNGKCKYLYNLCEGLTIDSSKYFIKNGVVTILESKYELTILDSCTLQFDKNVEQFTCNNKFTKDKVVLKK